TVMTWTRSPLVNRNWLRWLGRGSIWWKATMWFAPARMLTCKKPFTGAIHRSLTMRTYIHEAADGRKIEYRRGSPSDFVVLHLESRVLRRDGMPHEDGWYRVTDAELLWLQRDGGTEIIDQLTYAI